MLFTKVVILRLSAALLKNLSPSGSCRAILFSFRDYKLSIAVPLDGKIYVRTIVSRLPSHFERFLCILWALHTLKEYATFIPSRTGLELLSYDLELPKNAILAIDATSLKPISRKIPYGRKQTGHHWSACSSYSATICVWIMTITNVHDLLRVAPAFLLCNWNIGAYTIRFDSLLFSVYKDYSYERARQSLTN